VNDGALNMHGEDENSYNIFAGKPEGKRLFRGPMYTWEKNIKMDLKLNWVKWCGLDSSGSG
jgi:hypothetical protein